MKDYCTDTKACRHALLLAYFGERFAAGRCDNCCDNCLARQQGAVLLDDGIWLVNNPSATSAVSAFLDCSRWHTVSQQDRCHSHQDNPSVAGSPHAATLTETL